MNAAKRATRRSPAAASRPGRRWAKWVAGGAVAALVVTVAVVVSGFDSRETPREDPSVWVVRTAGQYARVNTETAEIDTVRQIEGPSGVVQSGSFGLLLSQGDGRAWTIDQAAPQDIRDGGGAAADGAEADGAEIDGAEVEDAEADGAEAAAAEDPSADAVEEAATADDDTTGPSAIRTPGGTRQVIAAGDAVLFFTEAGETHLAGIDHRAGASTLGAPVLLDPFAEENAEVENAEDRKEYRADAAAIDSSGLVALYSSSERSVRWYDIGAGEFKRATSDVPEGAPGEGAQLAIVGGRWVLLDTETGTLWRDGRSAVEIDLVGTALLQGSGADAEAVLVADEAGLWSVDGSAERVADAEGVPARPEQVGDDVVAAWIGSTSAAMWTASGGETVLDLDGAVEDTADPSPVIRTSGGRGLVTDMRSGMMWTVPDGRLIPVEQWTLIDPPKQETGTVITQDVTEQEPPVAVDDSFGVRAGEPALLPVLLNDYDPNRSDVLTVVLEGLGEGLSADFGTVEALSDGQGLMVQPGAAATGATSFSYRITDGVNVSPPATVTLTVVPESVNTAPQWCPVDGCQRSWPSPELAPGGTLVLPILEGWVDPEGDPMMLAEATPVNAEDPVRALVTADGRLAVRHTDSNASDGDIGVRVRIVDSRGEATERELRIRVRPGAAAEFAPIATTVKIGEPVVLRPLERVSGGSGSYALVDAVVQSGNASATVNQGAGTIEFAADTAGGSLVTVTVRDTITELEISGVVRVTAVEKRAALAVPPLRAFLRPLSDTTIEVLDAIPGANSRSLVVQSAAAVDGELRVDVIEHARLRLSGSTADGQPGRIGSADVVIAEGELTATGRVTVFQVPETSVGGAIAVADSVTVRAGSIVDIPVLDNDVAPPGERLVLHPEVGAPGAEGELAFASGSRVRYLAPDEPGSYVLSYTTYGVSSPENSDVGQVRVTVLPTGTNRDPQPPNVTVRLAPGESVTSSIPVSRADPDGDRVRLVTVGAPSDPQLSVSILPRSGTVQVAASTSAARGTHYVDYTVRDDFGGEATGRLRIIVTDPDPGGGAPVVYSDYVRIARGTAEPAVVRPLDNDIDPSGGTLTIVEVVPNVPGGEESPLYADLAARLDTSALEQGVVSIAGGDELGAFSYRYTVRSSKTKSTADGLIVVQVSDRIGRQAPTVQDTVLSVRDRAELKSSGVDVVTGRVRWATGDISKLELSLWSGAENSYQVSGSSIVGSYRAEGDLVPFKLTGPDASGEQVETYGFLIVPPLDEMRLGLKPGAGALAVDENKTVDADLRELLDLGPGDQIELADGPFGVQRSQASCVATGQTTIRYSAGKEAPWGDSCTVQVRLTEQNTYTSLPIPIEIKPDSPVVMLNPLTRTIAPGEGETIDLTDMVDWQGGREGKIDQLRWQTGAGSAPFEVTSSGSQVQVQVRADGAPGSQQVLAVSVSGEGESQAVLTLRVGAAAQDAPRGGTVSLQCTVDSNCTAPLVGVGGEYDPFAGKSGGGLHLVSVDSAGCQFGDMQASGDSVVVSWPKQRGPGGRCTASFTVRDAQDRTGTGQIEFDAQGVPPKPDEIVLVSAEANSVTLQVKLGEAASAHPSVTGVVVNMDGGGSVGSCTPSGDTYRCVVGSLNVGESHRFVARAVNGVGESDPTEPVDAWAFRQPELSLGQIDAVQRSAESTATGTVRVTVNGTDPTVKHFKVVVGGISGVIDGASGHIDIAGVAVGSAAYTVTPVSQFAPPSTGGSSEGSTVGDSLTVGGLPTVTIAATSAQGSSTADVTVTLDANGGGDPEVGSSVGAAACAPAEGGTSFTFSHAGSAHTEMTVNGCGSNEWGAAAPVSTAVLVGDRPSPPTVTEGWSVATNYSIAGSSAVYGLVSGPTVAADYTLQFTVNGAVSGAFPGGLDPNVSTTASVVQCVGSVCSDPVAITGNAPTTVEVVLPACIAEGATPAELLPYVSAAARSYAAPSYVGGVFTVGWATPFNNLQQLDQAIAPCP